MIYDEEKALVIPGIYRAEENVLLTYVTYFCTKKSFRRILVTLGAVRLRAYKLRISNQGMSSVGRVIRANKRKSNRRWHEYVVSSTLL